MTAGTAASHELGLTLALETSCDDTCAAVIDGSGRILSSISTTGRHHEKYGRVCGGAAAPAERLRWLCERHWRRGCAMHEPGGGGCHGGPGADRRPVVGFTRPRPSPGDGAYPFSRQPSSWALAPSGWRTSRCRSRWWRGRVRGTLHAGARDKPPPVPVLGRLWTMRGRGLDKGPAAGLGYRGARKMDHLRAGQIRRLSPFLLPSRRQLDFSFSGQDLPLLSAARHDRAGAGGQRGRTWRLLPPGRGGSVVGRLMRAAEREQVPRWPSAGGWRELIAAERVAADAESAGLREVIPPFRLATDNAAMIARLPATTRLAFPAI